MRPVLTRFVVTAPYTIKIKVPVDAETREEAIEQARNRLNSMTFAEIAAELLDDELTPNEGSDTTESEASP